MAAPYTFTTIRRSTYRQLAALARKRRRHIVDLLSDILNPYLRRAKNRRKDQQK